MRIEEAIDTYLKSITELTDVVNPVSIGWVDKPTNIEYPRVVFRMISNPKTYEFPDRWQRWRFFTYADDQWTCKEIGRILDRNFESLIGDMGGVRMSYVTKLDFPDPDYDEDRQKYVLTQDYRFVFVKE